MAIRFKIKGEEPEKSDDVEMEVWLRKNGNRIVLGAKVGEEERNIFILGSKGTWSLPCNATLPGLQTDKKGRIILED